MVADFRSSKPPEKAGKEGGPSEVTPQPPEKKYVMPEGTSLIGSEPSAPACRGSNTHG